MTDPLDPATAPPDPITMETMKQRLLPVTDAGIIGDVLDLAQKQLTSEDAQTAKIDARATSLFTAIGFSMTVAFSFGGWALLDNARNVPGGTSIAIMFVVVLLFGLVAGWFALRGLLLRGGYPFAGEEEFFNPTVLHHGRTQREYRIYIATYLWSIVVERRDRNEQRARQVMVGQRLFFGFLGALLVLSAFTTCSAITRERDQPKLALSCSVTLLSPPAPSPVTSLSALAVAAPMTAAYDGGSYNAGSQTAAPSASASTSSGAASADASAPSGAVP